MPVKKKINLDVRVSRPHHWREDSEEAHCLSLATDIKHLLEVHHLFDDVEVTCVWELIDVCAKCDKPLEYLPACPEDEIEGEKYCAWCGEIP